MKVTGISEQTFAVALCRLQDFQQRLGESVGHQNVDPIVLDDWEEHLAIKISNRYFKNINIREDVKVDISSGVDPIGVLARFNTGCPLAHTEDNVVEYFIIRRKNNEEKPK